MKSIVLIFFSFIPALLATANNSSNNEEQEIVTGHSHPYGRPINLLRFDEDENVIVETESLDKIFLHPDIEGRSIVAISIIGAFRKGKSFLMDYALRFMYANYKSIAYPDNPLDNKRDWIGDPEESLKGFTWRGGAARDTTGVVLWSDVFLYEQEDPKTKKMQKYAIILMDTQGLFDTKTSPTDNSRIFALGTLISSIQIFNLNDVIQENQLEYLQMATEFAKFAMKRNRKNNRGARNYKPFQTLIFLMRDWRNHEEYEYGLFGGTQYLGSVLTEQTKPQPKQLQDVRKYIAESFEKRFCFLLPHPGFRAINNKQYDGRFSELSEEFQHYLKDFLNWMLQPRNLYKKKILNNEVNGAEYLEYLKAYFEAFQSDEIPKIETLHGITVRKQYENVISEAFTKYKNQLKQVEFKIDEEWKEENVIEQEMIQNHQNGLNSAVQLFKDKKKLGNEADERKFESELRNKIEIYFNEWKVRDIEKYRNLKKVDEENKARLKKIEDEAREKLEKERKKAEEERKSLELQHQNHTSELTRKINEVKSNTTETIGALENELNRTRAEAEEQRNIMLKQLEQEKLEIKRKAEESEESYKKQVIMMQEEMKKKEEETRQAIENKKAEGLEALRNEAEQRKLEFERQMKIQELQVQALTEQRRFEAEQRKEEARIREEARIAEKVERERAERERATADREFQMKLIEMRTQADNAQRQAAEKKDEEWKEFMRMMATTARPIVETRGFNLWRCIGSIFFNC